MANEFDLSYEVDYATQVAASYLVLFAEYGLDPVGKRILELGPGMYYGGATVLRCLGADVVVADKYLSDWDEQRHPHLFRRLAGRIAEGYPAADTGPINQMLEAGAFCDETFQRVRAPCEALTALENDSIDIIVSNAVLEHLADPQEGLRELYRITKPYGFGTHQIDYRDHRDFSKPLEYLFMSEKQFQEFFAACRGECGNRYRSREFMRYFCEAGFKLENCIPNMFSEPEYFEDVLSRVRAVGLPYTEEDVRVISGRITVTKPGR